MTLINVIEHFWNTGTTQLSNVLVILKLIKIRYKSTFIWLINNSNQVFIILA